jgi:hypothetical protein
VETAWLVVAAAHPDLPGAKDQGVPLLSVEVTLQPERRGAVILRQPGVVHLKGYIARRKTPRALRARTGACNRRRILCAVCYVSEPGAPQRTGALFTTTRVTGCAALAISNRAAGFSVPG